MSDEMKNEGNETPEVQTETKKVSLVGKVKSKFRKAEKPAEPEGSAEIKPKKSFKQKLKDNKGKIIGGVVIGAAAVGAALKLLANAKADGEIDPDFETEPGDYDPEEAALDEMESQEVNEG